jgi:ribosomal protein S20
MANKSKQTEANKRWQEQNREKARYLRNRSTARNFIKKQATEVDLQELEGLMADRKKELKNINKTIDK